MNFTLQTIPKVKKILFGLIILIVAIAAIITVKDEISYQFMISDSGDVSQNEEETDCNVMGLNLHGMLLTYLPPDALNDNGDLAADISASENILSGITEAENDEKIKAIILEVDSQGGLPAAGYEIAAALKSAQKSTIALIRQMGASAAYMAASGADTIFASPYSDVGGIGVTQSYLENYEKNSREIRYEKKSTNFLWINICRLVFHHHPNDIDHLSAQTDKRLRLSFSLGYFSSEILSSRIISHTRYL